MRIWMIGFVMIMASMAGHALEPLSLNVLMGRALVVNPTIQASLMRAEAADSRAKVERGNLLPQVTANVSWGSRYADEPTGGQDRALRSKQLVVNQPLTLTEEYTRWQTFKAEADADLARAQGDIQRTLIDVADSYLTVLLETERVAVLRSLNDALHRQLIATRRMFEEGEGTKAHISAVKSRLSATRANVKRAEQALVEAQERLQSLITQDVEQKALVWPDVDPGRTRTTPAVVDHHPLVREARSRHVAQTYRMKTASADIFPEVGLTGSTSKENGLPTNLGVWENRMTVNVSIPLFRGGKTVYGIQAARNEAKATQLAVEGAEYEVRRELLSAREGIRSTGEAFAAARDGLEAQETALYGARLEYENGERSLTELLNAEQEYADVAVSHAAARKDRLFAQYRLRAAQGDLILP